MKSAWNLIVTLSFSILVFSPSITLAHAAAIYQPTVLRDQWAEYKPLYNICTVPAVTCQSSGNSLANSRYSAIHVVDVSGETVTLSLITVYTNGTGSHQGILVNVSTGLSNVTILPSLTSTPSDYFVLAGRLQENDTIWNTVSAPRFNRTMSENVLGM